MGTLAWGSATNLDDCKRALGGRLDLTMDPQKNVWLPLRDRYWVFDIHWYFNAHRKEDRLDTECIAYDS